jgi:hypothetical protein
VAVVVKPRRQIRWVGGGGNTNASTSSRVVSLTILPNVGDRLLLVSQVEGAAAITSVVQTGVTWAKLAETSLNTPKVEVWIGVAGSGAASSLTVSYNAGNFGGATVGVFENLIGTILARADGSSNTMAAFTAPRDNCLILFVIGQNTFGSYYTWFSGRNLQNLFPSMLSSVNQYVGAFWAVVPNGAVVSGTAQRSAANTGTLRSISLALI